MNMHPKTTKCIKLVAANIISFVLLMTQFSLVYGSGESEQAKADFVEDEGFHKPLSSRVRERTANISPMYTILIVLLREKGQQA